jgi:hypothetical protein
MFGVGAPVKRLEEDVLEEDIQRTRNMKNPETTLGDECIC